MGGRDLLAHVDVGSGPAVLLLPGAAADHGLYAQSGLIEQLAPDFRVIAVDWRGAGASPAMPEGYGFQDEVADLLHLLDHLNVDAAHVMGVSHGTAAALLLAHTHPDRVSSLVLASPWARTEPSMRLMFNAWQAIFGTEDMTAIGRSMIWWLFTPEFIDADSARAEAIAAGIFASENSPSPGTHIGVAQMNLGWDFTDRLGEVAVPTLVLAAENDRAIPSQYSRQVADGLPNATFTLVSGPGSGHAYLLEAAPGPGTTVVDFLRSTPTQPDRAPELAASSRPGDPTARQHD